MLTPAPNRSLEEVDEMFEKRVPAWRSRGKTAKSIPSKD